MLNVKLEALINEHLPSHDIDKGLGWAEWRALKLIDETTGDGIAEWFYVVACNEYYFDKEVRLSDKSTVGYFVQENFSENELLESARKEFEKLSFDDWDDFFEKMSEKFIYED